MGPLIAFVICTVILTGPGAAPVRAQTAFDVTGEIFGLYPGVETTLDASLTNPHPFAIDVTSVDVHALDANPACPGTLLAFGDLISRVSVPPHAAATIPLRVMMARAAPDVCQGVTWPLEFSGAAISTEGEPAVAPASSEDAPSSGIAFTGASIGELAVIGASLTVVGLVALAFRHRRRPAGSSDSQAMGPSR